MKKLPSKAAHVINNKHIIASERDGLASTMLQRHLTFADSDLTDRIRHMSVLETIN